MYKKNILVISTQAFALSETFIYRQVKVLSENFNVTLASYEEKNIEHFKLSGLKKIKLSYYENSLDRVLSAFLRRLRNERTGLSLFNHIKLLRYCRDHGISHIHIHYGTKAVQFYRFLAKSKIKATVSFHGFDASKALKKNSYRIQLKKLARHLDSVIVSSPHMIRNLEFAGIPKERFFLIPYGLDTEFFKRDEGSRNLSDKIEILHSGRLTPKKGVPDLIRVFAQLNADYPETRLNILGEGDDYEKCFQLVEKNALEKNVVFHGAKPISVVKCLMSNCDIFVLNSRVAEDGDMEGFPNALVEAMSMQMAVISTNHAGIPLAIDNELNGFLIEENNNEELFNRLIKLCGNYELRNQFASKAREKVVRNFSIESMEKKLLKVFVK